MTPMTKLKNNLENFKLLIGTQFNEINLNKSSPKEFTRNWCGEETHHKNKGVENDFVKLFKIKFNKEDAYAMAFIFTYIDLPEEKHTIEYSIKVGDQSFEHDYIISSDKMTVKDFKLKLNEVNKELKEMNEPTYEIVINTLNNKFIDNFAEKVKGLGYMKSTRNTSKKM